MLETLDSKDDSRNNTLELTDIENIQPVYDTGNSNMSPIGPIAKKI